MVANKSHSIARVNLNTICLRIRGYVWARFLSPRNYPVIDVPCRLTAGGYTWQEQKTTSDAEVCWEQVPLGDCVVQLMLGGRKLSAPVPWLRSLEQVHIQRLMDAEELIGPGACPYGIQVRLKGLGYNCGAVDGVIGPKTKNATRLFQTDRNLHVDSIPGSATQGYLKEIFGA